VRAFVRFGRWAAGRLRAILHFRPSIRLQLAALYGGLVLLAGAMLLSLTYALVTTQAELYTVKVNASGVVKSIGDKVALPNATILLRATPPPLPLANFVPPGNAGFSVGSGGASNILPSQVGGLVQRAVAVQQVVDRQLILVLGAIALILVTLLAMGAGWLVAGRILRPLQVMTSTARRLSAEVPGGRFALKRPRDEIKALADTFDAFLDRIDAALAAERRFVANASHELRTPLAVQKTLLEVALSDPDADAESLREMAGRLWQLNQRGRRLIEGLLDLARSEQALQARESVDLAAAARDALDTGSAEAQALDLTVEQELAPATAFGNRALLERLVSNLVENALRHNVRGGFVKVATAGTPAFAVLTVENSGPVIRPEDVAGLFEPFRRGAVERTESARGAGLGLSIVRAVARAHEGTVDAVAREGGGLRVEVRLPAAAQEL